MKILVARFEARILPLANRARVTPTTERVRERRLQDDALARSSRSTPRCRRRTGPRTRRSAKISAGRIVLRDVKITTSERTKPPSMPTIHGVMFGFGFAGVTRGHRPDPAADGGDEEHGEEADGLPDGVFDRHPVGLDGAGAGGGVHALELRVGCGIRRRPAGSRRTGSVRRCSPPAGRRDRSSRRAGPGTPGC